MARFARLFLFAGVGAAAFLGGWRWAEKNRPASVAPRLRVTARPAGAAIFVDDVFRGLAPENGFLEMDDLAPGLHALRVSGAGRQTVRQRVRLEAGSPKAAVPHARIELQPLPRAAVRVESTPPGALVLANGRPLGHTPLDLRGLEPGRHSFTLALDNHLSQTLLRDLSAGDANPPVVADLQDRQHIMYRARIAADPALITTYNDFAELLFAQGHKAAAADVFVEGFYRSALPGAREPQRINEALTKNDRRADREFMNAFNDAVAAKVREGKHSPKLIELFNQIRKIRPNDPTLLDALGDLARQTTDRTLKADYLERAAANGKFDNVLPVVDHWLENPGKRLGDYAALLTRLADIAGKAREAQNAELADACLERADKAIALVDAFRPLGGDARWPEARARYSLALGNQADYRRRLEGAVLAQLDPQVSNRLRLELAQAWWTEAGRAPSPDGEASRLARRWAARHAAHIVRQTSRNITARPGAEKLLETLAAAGESVEQEWLASHPLDDWMLLGPLLPEAQPETTPYLASQKLGLDGRPDAGGLPWRRRTVFLDADARLTPEAPEGWSGGVWHGIGWMKSGGPRSLLLTIDAPGPLVLWFNDALVWKTGEQEENAVVTLNVPQGWASLRFRLDGVDAAHGAVRLRVSDPDAARRVDNFLWTAGRE